MNLQRESATVIADDARDVDIRGLQQSFLLDPAAPPINRSFFLLGSLVVLVLAEYVVAYHSAGWGLVAHALLLIAFLGKAVLTDDGADGLYLALAVLPLVRILAISTPFWLTGQAGHFAMVNLPLIVATIVAARYLGFHHEQLGLTLRRWKVQIVVMASGPVIGVLERLIIQPPAMAPDLSLASIAWPGLSLLLFTGFSEELLFRGVLQTSAIRNLGPRAGIALIAAMFGALHIGWLSALDVAFVTAVGVYFGWVVHRTGSIVGVTLAHGIANITLFILLPNLGMV